MSEVSVTSDRFWREFRSDVAGTLSADQRGEIERVIATSVDSGSDAVSDLRLSFKWFFVRLAWGPEKRSPERIRHDLEKHPVMARRNLPMLASLFVGYMGFWALVFALATALLIYQFS